jgi:hypothetical protein
MQCSLPDITVYCVRTDAARGVVLIDDARRCLGWARIVRDICRARITWTICVECVRIRLGMESGSTGARSLGGIRHSLSYMTSTDLQHRNRVTQQEARHRQHTHRLAPYSARSTHTCWSTTCVASKPKMTIRTRSVSG